MKAKITTIVFLVAAVAMTGCEQHRFEVLSASTDANAALVYDRETKQILVIGWSGSHIVQNAAGAK
jgi:hypothetical protein